MIKMVNVDFKKIADILEKHDLEITKDMPLYMKKFYEFDRKYVQSAILTALKEYQDQINKK